MLKKISINDARIGMFIQEICGSWLNSPFWQKSFLLDTPNRLNILREYGVKELWINTDDGLDVIPDTPVVTEEEENQKVDRVLDEVVQTSQKIHQISFHEEIEHARKIHAKAMALIAPLFQQMRMGHTPRFDNVATLVDEIIASISRNTGAFLFLAQPKNKSEYSCQHAVAVCGLMIALGRQMDVEEDQLRNLGLAGLLHDAGNLLIPGKIRDKPGSLSDDEFAIMRTHPQLGVKILKDVPGIDRIVLDVCLHHHERVDGAGYPSKLSGEGLSLPARMCAVCEVYDSVISDRHYKPGMAPASAIRKMAEWQNGHFDLAVFHAFVKAAGVYPVGTLVRLASGRLAMVTDQSAKSLLTPVVKAFFSIKLSAPIFPEMVDLSHATDAIVSAESPAKWKLNMKAIMGI